MRRDKCLCLLVFIFFVQCAGAQKADSLLKSFFIDEEVLHVTVNTDIRNLLAEKKTLQDVHALVSIKFPDSTQIEEPIKIRPRGHFRKENCYLSSLSMLFNSNPSNKLAGLKSIKMVGACSKSGADEQYLLKEFLIYKMYNLLTDLSFRVRLIRITYNDTRKKVNSFSQFAFFLEDVDAVAKRNNYKQKKIIKFSPAGTQQYQTTLMSVYQYMIGNTDWSIPNYHNIRLVVPRADTNGIPLPIPYDFDMTGCVNPPYAGTSPLFHIEKVTDRLYRGFPVTAEVTQKVVDLFLQKEKEILYLIYTFEHLNKKSRHDMTTFLYSFFAEIKDKAKIKSVFITNARKE